MNETWVNTIIERAVNKNMEQKQDKQNNNTK